MKKVFAVWHEGLIVPVYAYSRCRVAHMVSNHRDGELIAQIIHRLGGVTARGSSTRGGRAAVLSMLRAEGATQLAVTPDGPKGPRRKAKKGVVFIASQSQMPLVALGVSVKKCWRVGSWDKMIIPKPFSRAYLVFSELMNVPSDISSEQMQEYLDELQQRLEKTQNIADRLADGEKLDLPLVRWKQTLAKSGVEK